MMCVSWDPKRTPSSPDGTKRRVAKISTANGLPSLRYRTVNMRMTLQFLPPPESRSDAEIFTPLLMEHFRRWGLVVHAGSYSPHKESKTEILFCARPHWSYQDKETFDDTNLDDLTLYRTVDSFLWYQSFDTWEAISQETVPIQMMSEQESTLLLVHLEHYQSAFFNRHTSNVMPNELCSVYERLILRPYVSTDARAGASKKLFIMSCANSTLAVWEQWAERIYTTPGSITSQLKIWRSSRVYRFDEKNTLPDVNYDGFGT